MPSFRDAWEEPTVSLRVDRVLLDQLQVAVKHRMAEELGAFTAATSRLEVERRLDWIGQELLFSLRAYVLAEHLVDETVTLDVDVPASWFQHLKARHMRRWVLKRWPVRTIKVTEAKRFQRDATYPKANIGVPADRLGQPVYVERITRA